MALKSRSINELLKGLEGMFNGELANFRSLARKRITMFLHSHGEDLDRIDELANSGGITNRERIMLMEGYFDKRAGFALLMHGMSVGLLARLREKVVALMIEASGQAMGEDGFQEERVIPIHEAERVDVPELATEGVTA